MDITEIATLTGENRKLLLTPKIHNLLEGLINGFTKDKRYLQIQT